VRRIEPEKQGDGPRLTRPELPAKVRERTPLAPWAWVRFWDAAAEAALLGILHNRTFYGLVVGAETRAVYDALAALPPAQP
jgi:hypothetical protein